MLLTCVSQPVTRDALACSSAIVVVRWRACAECCTASNGFHRPPAPPVSRLLGGHRRRVFSGQHDKSIRGEKNNRAMISHVSPRLRCSLASLGPTALNYAIATAIIIHVNDIMKDKKPRRQSHAHARICYRNRFPAAMIISHRLRLALTHSS